MSGLRENTRLVPRYHLGLLPLFLVLLTFLSSWAEAGGRESTDSANLERLTQLHNQLRDLQPGGYYILIDTASNTLSVKHGDEVVLEAPCSTGSGRRFESDGRTWTFETPRGEFEILAKIREPVWRKPDWAFLEKGEAPPEDEGRRYQKHALGDYALSIGGPYFIHGTIYERTLGLNVTHGCVRVGSDDLLRLVEMVPLGTKVYIF